MSAKRIPDLFNLSGRTAVVTGVCGNLGPFWVKALLEAGSRVAGLELSGVSLPPFLQKKSANNFLLLTADVTKRQDLKKALTEITRKYGKVSILVNNAGIDISPQKGKIAEQEDLNRKLWAVNVQGLVNCIFVFAQSMKENRGSIINIGSLYLERSPDERLYDHLGFDKPWVYGATKAAVHQVTRHFATRLAKYGIRVNTLSPGGVFNHQDEGFIGKFIKKVPLGRMAEKDKDLSGPLVFLASDASAYVTGINLAVNGGYTAW